MLTSAMISWRRHWPKEHPLPGRDSELVMSPRDFRTPGNQAEPWLNLFWQSREFGDFPEASMYLVEITAQRRSAGTGPEGAPCRAETRLGALGFLPPETFRSDTVPYSRFDAATNLSVGMSAGATSDKGGTR